MREEVDNLALVQRSGGGWIDGHELTDVFKLAADVEVANIGVEIGFGSDKKHTNLLVGKPEVIVGKVGGNFMPLKV